uniref:Uncharacterized protein n=1 Tax=uncultured marine bacterium MedDCM-OCT-S04-C7 TaxID=743059 RepID=D6PD71_9BACT|nr:hypothetical protein [uncultured marine bacterium MedDCM-OCT-S04-C7]
MVGAERNNLLNIACDQIERLSRSGYYEIDADCQTRFPQEIHYLPYITLSMITIKFFECH